MYEFGLDKAYPCMNEMKVIHFLLIFIMIMILQIDLRIKMCESTSVTDIAPLMTCLLTVILWF